MQSTKNLQRCEVKRTGPAGQALPLLDTLETTDRKSPIEGASERKRRSRKVAKQLKMIGYEGKARKIEQCASMLYRRSFSCGHESHTRHGQWESFYLCKDKFCPNCNHVRSLKLSRSLGGALERYASEQGLHAYHVVLTFLNTDSLPDYERIRRQARRLFDSGSRVRKAFWDRYGYHGAVMNFEVTVARDGRFHPHFHVLLFTERPIELIESGEHSGKFQNKVNQELSDMWLSITKDSYILQGQSFEFSHMFEMVKYLTKGVDMIPDEQLSELVEWSSGRRFISLIGKLYKNEQLKQLTEAEDMGDSECCPECGCNEYVDIPMRFDLARGQYVDDEYWTGEIIGIPRRAP